MNRRFRKERLASEINITPFTDVILVLLIIFMIATPLLSQTNIPIKLPKTKHAEAAQGRDQLTITITAEDVLYVDNKIVTQKELNDRVSLAHKQNPQIGVELMVDQTARFKSVVDVLDMLKAMEIDKINIAATPID